MRQVVLTFGLIAGTVLSAMLLITLPFQEQIGIENGELIGYTTMVLAFLMVFVGVKTYRDNVAGGQVSFGRAFSVGLLITLVAAACYVATWELIFYKLDPTIGDKMLTATAESMKASGASAAEIAAKQEELAAFLVSYRKPWVNVAITLIEPLPIGLLFTLISAFVLSRRRRTGGDVGSGERLAQLR